MAAFLRSRLGAASLGFVSVGTVMAVVKDIKRGDQFKGNIRADGKVAVVTGANSGIGFETARELAYRGAEVYMACRNMRRCKIARQAIIEETNSETVYCCKCDLSSQRSIREFVETFKSEKKKLDLLVNNAAVMKCKRLQTSENIELQFGVNHLGHFLLTNLLLDELKAAQQSRIIVVADKDYVQGRISVDDLNSEKTYNKHDAYNRSKLANMLFVHELSQRLRGTGVTVNAVTSDHIDTALHRYRWYYNGFVWPFMYTFLKTPQGGAKCTLYVALKKSLKKTSGKCFSDCKETKIYQVAKDDVKAKWLWTVSEKWTRIAT